MTPRKRFYSLCTDCGTDPVAEETAILSIGEEFLPACAIAVRDGGEPTDEYWTWLVSQTEQAQAEHDAEMAAGHEWHLVEVVVDGVRHLESKQVVRR